MNKLDTNKAQVQQVVLRFAGDSGDGIQYLGSEFANIAAFLGNDVYTLPDYPAEIRAPAGTLPGVSGFQLQFAATDIHTPGDRADVLIAFNPAALKANLAFIKPQALIIVNENNFTERDLKKAGYVNNPLENELQQYQIVQLPLTDLIVKTFKDTELPRSQLLLAKNLYMLGIVFYLYDRDLDISLKRIAEKFAKKPALLQLNQEALRAGYAYAEVTELFPAQVQVAKAVLPQGTYRYVTGNEAFAFGCAALATLSQRPVLVSGYPITPASTVLHQAAKLTHFSVKTFQAEDEIAAIGAAIGAAYGGHLAVTITSGPGFDLKTEALGLAIMTELPLIVIDIQRAGPSTGMPTKVEQTDLLQVIYGRHGGAKLPVLAPAAASDCFTVLIDAARLAVTYMTPVVILSDAYLASSAAPWQLPNCELLPPIQLAFPQAPAEPTATPFMPYARDPATLARPWAIPGTPGLIHRIGGLEKSDRSGQISYDPQNHERMMLMREEKIANIANAYEGATLYGAELGDCLVITWGASAGAVRTVIENFSGAGVAVSALVLTLLFPLPTLLTMLLPQFKTVCVVELNQGQLATLIKSTYLHDVISITKMTGQPFLVSELTEKIQALLTANASAT